MYAYVDGKYIDLSLDKLGEVTEDVDMYNKDIAYGVGVDSRGLTTLCSANNFFIFRGNLYSLTYVKESILNNITTKRVHLSLKTLEYLQSITGCKVLRLSEDLYNEKAYQNKKDLAMLKIKTGVELENVLTFDKLCDELDYTLGSSLIDRYRIPFAYYSQEGKGELTSKNFNFSVAINDSLPRIRATVCINYSAIFDDFSEVVDIASLREEDIDGLF